MGIILVSWGLSREKGGDEGKKGVKRLPERSEFETFSEGGSGRDSPTGKSFVGGHISVVFE
jgi:hypothetical protein